MFKHGLQCKGTSYYFCYIKAQRENYQLLLVPFHKGKDILAQKIEKIEFQDRELQLIYFCENFSYQDLSYSLLVFG